MDRLIEKVNAQDKSKVNKKLENIFGRDIGNKKKFEKKKKRWLEFRREAERGGQSMGKVHDAIVALIPMRVESDDSNDSKDSREAKSLQLSPHCSLNEGESQLNSSQNVLKETLVHREGTLGNTNHLKDKIECPKFKFNFKFTACAELKRPPPQKVFNSLTKTNNVLDVLDVSESMKGEGDGETVERDQEETNANPESKINVVETVTYAAKDEVFDGNLPGITEPIRDIGNHSGTEKASKFTLNRVRRINSWNSTASINVSENKSKNKNNEKEIKTKTTNNDKTKETINNR